RPLLIQAGLRTRRPVWKLLLTDIHRNARLNWARTHLRIQDAEWQSVAFSDEVRFELYIEYDRKRVQRRIHELYPERCVQPRVQSGGDGQTISAAFHYRAKSPIVLLEGILSQLSNRRRSSKKKFLPFAFFFFFFFFNCFLIVFVFVFFCSKMTTPHVTENIQKFIHFEGMNRLPWPA
ncbi:hypothetical protein CAPTEDRAFT_108251, partial [Capitella teleta]